MQALKDYILIIQDEKPKQEGKFLLPESDEKTNSGVVEMVGKKVKNVTKGDRVFYKQYSNYEVEINGKKYQVVKEDDIIAKE